MGERKKDQNVVPGKHTNSEIEKGSSLDTVKLFSPSGNISKEDRE